MENASTVEFKFDTIKVTCISFRWFDSTYSQKSIHKDYLHNKWSNIKQILDTPNLNKCLIKY